MFDKPWNSHATHHVLTQRNTLCSKEETENMPTNKTWNKVSAFRFCHFFNENSNNKYPFVALYYVVKDRCKACEPWTEIFSSLLVIVLKKREWTLEGILFQLRNWINTHHFSKSTDVNLLFSLICLVFFRQKGIWCYNWSDRLSIKLPVKEFSIHHFFVCEILSGGESCGEWQDCWYRTATVINLSQTS